MTLTSEFVGYWDTGVVGQDDEYYSVGRRLPKELSLRPRVLLTLVDRDQPKRWSYHEVRTSTLETERLKARGVTFEPYYIKDLVDGIC